MGTPMRGTTLQQPSRCPWPGDDELMLRYHDEEWGTPLHDDTALFEFLSLEGAQAGLSWRTILHKRAAFQRAFHGFDPAVVAGFGSSDVDRLMGDSGIVRSRAKLEAVVHNARLVLDAQREFGSLDAYLWSFTDGRTLRAEGVLSSEMVPATTPESGAMAKDLKRRGFKFVGPTTCYAFMQATGMVNDHVSGCFRALAG